MIVAQHRTKGGDELGAMFGTASSRSAFTLIELSIVLVVIGLLAGGILVGYSLIGSSGVQATITQIQKYQTAVNNFDSKYNALPGDMNATTAAQYAFVSRTGTVGRGDGNGIIEGFNAFTLTSYGWNADGEPFLFWEDLTSAQLIDGSFNTATDIPPMGFIGSQFSLYVPQAKVSNNYIYVFSVCHLGSCGVGIPGTNYFGLTSISSINSAWAGTNGSLTVSQAYQFDAKVDDGLPTTGSVQAFYPGGSGGGAGGGGNLSGTLWAPNAASASSTTCFDTTTYRYSLTQNSGTGVNCGLSFQFQ